MDDLELHTYVMAYQYLINCKIGVCTHVILFVANSELKKSILYSLEIGHPVFKLEVTELCDR